MLPEAGGKRKYEAETGKMDEMEEEENLPSFYVPNLEGEFPI